MCILALSLGVVWGYGGILCFGQSAFFGLGAYTYAVTAINLGESHAGHRAVGGRARRVRRSARLLHVLRTAERRVPRRHHAQRDAHLLQSDEQHRRRRLSDRQRPAQRLQRHAVAAHLQRAGQPGPPARSDRDVLPRHGAAADRLRRAARAAGQPLRARGGGGARERDALRAARLRRAPAQAADLHAGRRHRRPGRQPLRQLGRLRQPQRLQPGHDLADHHLGHRGRARHARRADHRLPDHAVPGHRARHPAARQHQPDLRDHLPGLRAAGAARHRAVADRRPGAPVGRRRARLSGAPRTRPIA